MTDLEMTRLCAEAMGLNMNPDDVPEDQVLLYYKYDPLHDDAQAMELVKKFKPEITFLEDLVKVWLPQARTKNLDYQQPVIARDLNRAIVECCARMQAAKAPHS